MSQNSKSRSTPDEDDGIGGILCYRNHCSQLIQKCRNIKAKQKNEMNYEKLEDKRGKK